ncbi:MAG: hypothetical protein JSV51_10120 [Candidatus Bathyarchaeota archaeon]|nr:MAG: hypothetical protein JSV51_10120 [Candidatus Bathyarchaeota archaeon]
MKAYRYYRKRGFLKRAFLDLAAQVGHERKSLEELSDEEVNEAFKKLNLARWFYQGFAGGLFGYCLILAGILIQILLGS